MAKKYAVIAAVLVMNVVLFCLGWNLGRAKAEQWYLEHFPRGTSAVIVRSQSLSMPCTLFVDAGAVGTIQSDGQVNGNTTHVDVKNCKFQWVLPQ